MAKRPVTMSLRDDDLALLDEFAGARRLTRGDAVGVLLENYQRSLATGQRDSDPEYVPPPPPPNARMALGRAVLEQAQKYTGVHPVEVKDGWVEKGFDAEAEKNLDEFYKRKGQPAQGKSVEDVSQDPEDW